MERDEAIQNAWALIDRARIVMLGTNGDEGTPNIKAMIKVENEGLNTVWLSTNTSSRRVAQLLNESIGTGSGLGAEGESQHVRPGFNDGVANRIVAVLMAVEDSHLKRAAEPGILFPGIRGQVHQAQRRVHPSQYSELAKRRGVDEQ